LYITERIRRNPHKSDSSKGNQQARPIRETWTRACIYGNHNYSSVDCLEEDRRERVEAQLRDVDDSFEELASIGIRADKLLSEEARDKDSKSPGLHFVGSWTEKCSKIASGECMLMSELNISNKNV